MDLLPVRVPKSALLDLTSIFVARDIPTGSVIELIIRTDETGLTARELSAYFALADRVYGRLSRAGIRSYAQRPYSQLEIAEIRVGSIEFVINEIISHLKDATPLVTLWLFLKYLPSVIKSVSETAKNAADAFKSFEEGKLARENRKRLKNEIVQDEAINRLDNKKLNQLVRLLDDLYRKEIRELPAAKRFAEKNVKSVTIVVKSKK